MQDNTMLQERLSQELESLELRFAHWMGKTALLGLVLLPLVPGLLAMVSIGTKFPAKLDIPDVLAWGIGAATALGIELLGLIAVRLALKMRRFNKRAEGYKVEHAPIGQGYAAACLYVATVLTLTMLLKVWPDLALFALLPMSLLGALADWIYALSSDQNEREQVLRRLLIDEQTAMDRDLTALEAEVERLTAAMLAMVDKSELDAMSATCDKLEAEAVRLTNLVDRLTTQGAQVVKMVDKQSVNHVGNVDGDDDKEPDKRLSKGERQEALLWRLREVVKPDDIDTAALSDEFGTSERTIKRDIEDLVQAQRLSVNGIVKVM